MKLQNAIVAGVTLIAITTMGCSVFADEKQTLLPPEHPEWKENWGERAAWSRARIRSHNTGYFDMFDLPDNKKVKAGSYPMELAGRPGEFIDAAKDYADKPVMMVFVNPSNCNGWKGNKLSQAIKDYQILYDEFHPRGVEFITVYSDAPKNVKDMASRRKKAEVFFAENKFPGILAVDGVEKNGFQKYCKMSSNMYNSAASVFKDAANTIVYRGNEPQFFPCSKRLVLQRIMDNKFNEAIQAEFPSQARTLPVLDKQKEYLVYKDDFESYADSFALKISPRWGFHYETQYRLAARAGIQKAAGVDGSKAAFIYSDYWRGHEGSPNSNWKYALEHDFPVPLSEGSFRFKLMAFTEPIVLKGPPRHAYETYQGKLATDLVFTFFRPEGVAPSAYLLVKNGTFLLIDDNFHIRHIAEKGDVPMKSKRWYEIELHAKKGKRAELFIDGKSLGKLQSESIIGMNIRCRPAAEFLLDDVELAYRGKPDTLAAQHKSYQTLVKKVQVGELPYPFTAEEKKSFQYRVKKNRGEGKDWFFDNPMAPNGNLLFEKIYKPGTYVDIMKNRKGKPVYIHSTQSLQPNGLLKRIHSGSAKALPVRQMTHALKGQLEIYDITSQYFENSMVSYEEFRLLRHEQRVVKLEARKLFERVHFWEVDEACDEDHSLLAYNFDDRWNEWSCVFNSGSIWGGSHGSLPLSMTGLYLNADGKIMTYSSGEYNYHEGQWPIMRATIDPKLAASMVNDFEVGSPIVRQKTLPGFEETAEGTFYRDNFDSYKNNTELTTQPCWGFSYKAVNKMSGEGYRHFFMYRSTIDPKEGVNGSNAMFVDCSHRLNRVAATPQAGRKDEDRNRKTPQQGAMKHIFPKELTNGHFKCSVRQSLKAIKQSYGGRGKKPNFTGRWFWLEFLDKNGKVIDAVTTTGQSMNDKQDSKTSLCLDINKSGEVSIAEKWERDKLNAAYPQLKKWYEIKLVAKEGAKAEVFVNDTSIGTIQSESIAGIRTYARDGDGMYMDDVELFYEK